MNKDDITTHTQQPYIPVIGLEVHVELKTASKMFCGCNNNWFGKEPNTHTCPVCLGLPGALPVPNKKAIEGCIKIAMALNCEINQFSKFDRKNYFYPDLAKGYQISQYDLPFGQNGEMELSTGKKVRIRRVHMEEDTGKLLHETINGEKVSLIDFNRSGCPLVEIVTEPDFDNATEVKEYLQKLQQIVRYLDIADANMEKGQMRLEPNISLRKSETQALPTYKVEVKNINSFSFVEKAINFEIKRQQELLERNELPKQETRGWNEGKNETIHQRYKEEAMDYRYFPEPDIPPIRTSEQVLEEIQKAIPELPNKKRKRFIDEYKLPSQDIEILTRDKPIADFYEETVLIGKKYHIEPKKVANIIINQKLNPLSSVPAEVIKQIIETAKIEEISEVELLEILEKIIINNPKPVEEYKNGKLPIIMFLVGQAMKQLKGRTKADIVKEKFELLLQNK